MKLLLTFSSKRLYEQNVWNMQICVPPFGLIPLNDNGGSTTNIISGSNVKVGTILTGKESEGITSWNIQN